MRWATYTTEADPAPRAGLLIGGAVHGLGRASLLDLLERGPLESAAREAATRPSERMALADVRLEAPIPVPPSIRDFMSFETHVVTSMAAIGGAVNPVWYEQPVFYFSNPAAVQGPADPVPIAPGTTKWDFELEVAAVIGTPGRDIPVERAESHIAGYTILCDWSARDHQERESRVGLGPAKGKDTASTLGPWLVSTDELEPYRRDRGFDLQMTVSVNDRPYSSGNMSTLYWSFAQMVSYASRGTELRAGDVIGSGTVGTGCILELSRVHGSESYPWLQAGDRVGITVDHLGSYESTIVTGAAPLPY